MRTCTTALSLLLVLPPSGYAQLAGGPAPASPPSKDHAAAAVRELAEGKRDLLVRHFQEAAMHFRNALAAEPDSVPARLNLADAELGLHQYEAAELDYRRVVATEPQMWVAHKNLVIVEAALGRWEEFDRERALLRAARERGADGISAHESDVIDGFDVAGRHWIVREYFEPVGRSQAHYNFEQFSPDGRATVYISLEPEDAANAALTRPDQVSIGSPQMNATAAGPFVLNWYTGKAHGTVRTYSNGEPSYEHVREDAVHFIRSRPVS